MISQGMTLTELVQAGKFVVTAELSPTKGVDLSRSYKHLDSLKGKVDLINVTDQQGGVMRVGSLAVSHLLKERSFEPIFQLTCRDRNRLALQSDLLSASLLGIRHILCLTGDHPTRGDHPDAKPVYDLDSVSLLMSATNLQNGFDLSGKPLESKPVFCLGATAAPGMIPMEPQLIKAEAKVRAGAQFFQTQAVFDMEVFHKFMERMKKIGVPVLAGVLLLTSARMAHYINKNIAGLIVPDSIVSEMEKSGNAQQTGIDIAVRIIQEVRGLCQGVHIMTGGREDLLPAVIEKVKI